LLYSPLVVWRFDGEEISFIKAAIRLFRIGLRCIGIVKTATTGYPMVYLGRVLLPDGKGDRHGVVTFDEESGCQLLAFVWSDRDRRHFISTCSSLASGNVIERTRWKQVDTTPNANPERKGSLFDSLKLVRRTTLLVA